MKKDEIISMLQQQNTFLQQQLKDALQQLGESNRKVDELLRKVSSLEELLVQKNAEERKQQNIIKGLTKIQRISQRNRHCLSPLPTNLSQIPITNRLFLSRNKGKRLTMVPSARNTMRWRSRRRTSILPIPVSMR